MDYTINYHDGASSKKLLDAYRGTGGFIDGSYLSLFPAESDNKYAFRKSTALYDNAFKMVIDGNISPIYNNVLRENTGESKLLELFLNDSDGAGTPLSSKIRQIGTEGYTTGCEVIFFDNVTTTDYLGEAKARGQYPKIVNINISQITGSALDELGNIAYLEFWRSNSEDKYTYTFDEGDSEYPNGYFSAYEYRTVNGQTDLIEGSEVKIPAIMRPIVYTFGKLHPSGLPQSEHYALLSQAVAVYSIDSLIQYQSNSNTFKMYKVKGVKFDDDGVKFNEATVVELPTDGDFDVIEHTSTASELQETKDAIRTSMFENYNLAILNTSANASGDSREQADILRQGELLRKSEIAELLERLIVAQYGELIGENLDYLVEYPTEFQPTGMKDLIANAKMLLEMDFSPETLISIKQDIMAKYLSSKSKEEREAILKAEAEYTPIDYDDDLEDPIEPPEDTDAS